MSRARASRIGKYIKVLGGLVALGIAGCDHRGTSDPGGPRRDATEATTVRGAPPVPLDGRAIYHAACAACHSAGIAGAPKTGERDSWAPRLDQGMDLLVKHATEGFEGRTGYMPPRGGHSNLTDAQVRDAVQYMLDALEDQDELTPVRP